MKLLEIPGNIPNKTRVCGIYLAVNEITGEKYVGASVCVRGRVLKHRKGHGLTKGAINKDRIEINPIEFSYYILEECGKELLKEKEKLWMEKVNPEYNLVVWTEKGKQNPSRIVSDRMAKTKRSKPVSEKLIKVILDRAERNRGKKRDPEMMKRLAQFNIGNSYAKGIPKSAEMKAKLSATAAKRKQAKICSHL